MVRHAERVRVGRSADNLVQETEGCYACACGGSSGQTSRQHHGRTGSCAARDRSRSAHKSKLPRGSILTEAVRSVTTHLTNNNLRQSRRHASARKHPSQGYGSRSGGCKRSLDSLTIGWLWCSPCAPPAKPYGTAPPPAPGACMGPAPLVRMGLNPWLQPTPHAPPPPPPPMRPPPLCGNMPPILEDDRLLPRDGEVPFPELELEFAELRRRGRSPLPASFAPLDHWTLTVVPRMTCVDASATTALRAAAWRFCSKEDWFGKGREGAWGDE